MAKGHGGDFLHWLRELPAAIGALEEVRGEPLVVDLLAEPPEHSRRLLEALGCQWRVVPVRPVGGRGEGLAEGSFRVGDGSVEGRTRRNGGEMTIESHVHTTGIDAALNGRDALDRMDAGERQLPVSPPQPEVKEPKQPKGSPNRESLIAEMRAYADAHDGQPPRSDRAPGSRIYYHARKLGLTWAELVQAAGLEPRPIGSAKEGDKAAPSDEKRSRTAKPVAPPPLTLAAAAAALEEAQAELDRAQEAYEDAFEAFTSHTLMQKIKHERGF